MPVQINIPIDRISAKVDGAWEKGLPLLAKEIRDDCNLYCKEETGALISSSLTHSVLDKGKIVWATPYARRQYWAIKTSLTPGRVWKWAHYAKGRHMQQWTRQAQALLKMNL